MRSLYRLLGIGTAFRAARRGPSALARQRVRARSNRYFNHWLRKVLKP